jgi:hypothetical protein
MSAKIPNHGESKIFDTLVNEIDGLKKQLKQSLDKKLKDHKSSVDQKKETINKETQNKINDLLNMQEKSIEKLNLEEQNFIKTVNDCAMYQEMTLETEQFKKRITQLSFADLHESSKSLKEILNDKISKLVSFNMVNSLREAKSSHSMIVSSNDYRTSLHNAIRNKKVRNSRNQMPEIKPFVFSESVLGSVIKNENFVFDNSASNFCAQNPYPFFVKVNTSSKYKTLI